MKSLIRLFSLTLLAIFFIAAGINHFVKPDFYVDIMPSYVPLPLTMVYVSGFFEILGGCGLFVPRLRKLAAWGLIALLVAVFPVHVQMVLMHEQYSNIAYWMLVARIPLQFVFMAWVYFTALTNDAAQ